MTIKTYRIKEIRKVAEKPDYVKIICGNQQEWTQSYFFNTTAIGKQYKKRFTPLLNSQGKNKY